MTVQDGVPPVINKLNLGYRSTTMWGLDLVTFFGDFTIRMESAFFLTKTPLLKLKVFLAPLDLYEYQEEINYFQSVLQVEYSTPSDITLSFQLINNQLNNQSYEWYHTYSNELGKFTKMDYQPGMGTPFAMLSDKALLISSTGVLMDDHLEINGNIMMNLDDKGQMIGMKIGYSPLINWKIEAGITMFSGDENNPENKFTRMEDFSNSTLGLVYNF